MLQQSVAAGSAGWKDERAIEYFLRTDKFDTLTTCCFGGHVVSLHHLYGINVSAEFWLQPNSAQSAKCA